MDLPLLNKTALVTGATDGIGRVTALELAKMGAHVVIIGRNPEKTENTAHVLRDEACTPKVDALVGDLSSLNEVRRLAAEYRQRYTRLDILVNNAGAIFMQRQLSVDGLEMTFALNHMGYFLLTYLLEDMLKASAPARIVNVSSAAHLGGDLDLNDLQTQKGYSGWKAYSRSKLLNVLFTYELARRLQGSGVTANALHPGFVATNFGKSNGGLFRPLFGFAQRAGALNPQSGAATSIYLASSPEVEGVTGKYFDNCRPVRSSQKTYDEQAARRLWELSLQIAGETETA